LDRRTTRGVPSPRNINASQYIESHRSVGTTSPAHPCPARLGVKPWEGGSLCTGNLSLTFAVGPVSLIYNSMDAASAGPGGFGMRLGFRDRITPNADGSVTRVMASGEPVVFTPDGQGGFRSPPETDDTMTRPSADRYVLKVRGGTKMTYRNPNGSAWLLGSIADRVGNTTIIAVDAANRETSVTDPVGNVTRLAWSQGRIASVTNAEGLIWTLQYTGGELTGIRHPAVNGTAPVETLAYDGGGRHLLLTHTSPEGVAVARFEYNADGSLAASLDPEGPPHHAHQHRQPGAHHRRVRQHHDLQLHLRRRARRDLRPQRRTHGAQRLRQPRCVAAAATSRVRRCRPGSTAPICGGSSSEPG
jgi:YD repeat-containing protein